jgi:hypothetical protein
VKLRRRERKPTSLPQSRQRYGGIKGSFGDGSLILHLDFPLHWAMHAEYCNRDGRAKSEGADEPLTPFYTRVKLPCSTEEASRLSITCDILPAAYRTPPVRGEDRVHLREV